MLKITVVCVGKLKESFMKQAQEEYSKRLSKYCKLQIIELEDEKVPDKLNSTLEQSIKEKEGLSIIKHLPKDSHVIGLDLSGKTFTSCELSSHLDFLSFQTSSLTFVIGGTLGLSKQVLGTCQELVSFSELTFPHGLIRIFLLEQLFRCFKISKGETYHR